MSLIHNFLQYILLLYNLQYFVLPFNFIHSALSAFNLKQVPLVCYDNINIALWYKTLSN